MIFYNGPVLTMEPDKPEAEALAVRGDTIVAVGDMQDVMALAGPETVLIDLAGNAIMPGFVDAHLHPFSDIGSAETVEADQQRLLAGGLTTVGELACGQETGPTAARHGTDRFASADRRLPPVQHQVCRHD